MGRDKSTPIDALFNKDGEVRHKTPLSPFFLRKPYQYTIAEPKDNTQQRLHQLPTADYVGGGIPARISMKTTGGSIDIEITL